jgi:phosphoenolpyruvate carboxykinase (ATP)
MSTSVKELYGIRTSGKVYSNLSSPALVEHALRREEGFLASNGALVVRTGSRTGRSPNDKFTVEDSTTKEKVWWGKVNRPVSAETFDRLVDRAKKHLSDRDLFLFDGFVGADPATRIGVRVIAEKAWHALFARTLFRRPTAEELSRHQADYTVIGACEGLADPEKDGVSSEVFVGIDFSRKIILILGSHYAGEIKKALFTVMNFLLPQRGIFPMHCSANVGKNGETALFFGLSGTGKTTLSADPARRLIGDDEHGWSDTGVFNFEGGCYAKCIHLSQEAEPQIYNAIRFGSVLENVVVDTETRAIDYDDGSVTENTRATYPVDYIDNCVLEGVGGHPRTIMLLTCDAFGVLPPIAKLTPDLAMFHFLSGYTAKLAGTEAGIDEPQATFSTCFGAPFLPLHPTTYAGMLGEKMKKHDTRVYLVNTGWSGGSFGVGKRMSIKLTRALVTAALDGVLEKQAFKEDPVFKVLVPESCPDVDSQVLVPRNTWKDKKAYDEKAKHLAGLFVKNFEQYRSEASEDVVAAAPKVD